VTAPPPAITADRPLAPLTSWKIGGPAAFFAEPADAPALAACLEVAEARRLPVLALGGGTNLLIADEGYPGLVVRCGARQWAIEDQAGEEARVRAGARAPFAALARALAQSGWAGLEWAEGIPGTVGGATVGNAGAYGGDLASICVECATWSKADGLRRRPAAALEFGYRRSLLSGQDPTGLFALETILLVRRDDTERLAARLRELGAHRRARTPVGLSCGSVFRNPPGDFAGRLIEACGLKGRRQGGAQISPQHANYILNTGQATARDVLALIDEARSRVRREHGIELELEVRTAGFAPGLSPA